MATSILRPAPGQVNSPTTLARVPFRGGFILAAAGPVDQEGNRPVPLRPFCEALGLDPDTQARKLRGKAWACTVIMTVQIPGDDQTREVFCLPLRALPMWLATIHPAKVAPGARPMLEAFQAEACDVLYRHFLAPSTPAADVAQLAADVASLRAEMRELQDHDRRRTHSREPAPLGMGSRLSPEDAARVRAYCETHPIVATADAMREALGLEAWGKIEASALAAELRALGYDRRKTYLPPPSVQRQAWRWRRPVVALALVSSRATEAALWPALSAARPPPRRKPCRGARWRCRRCSTSSPPMPRPAATSATPSPLPSPCARS